MAQFEKGSIADYALERVLEHLASSRASGMLEVRSPRGKKFILLKEGEVLLASEGEFRREHLGELLIAREKVSRPNIEKALETQKNSGQKLGEVLVEMGLISPQDIEEVLKFQIEEEICDLFSWKQGVYEFKPNEDLPKQAVATAIRLTINPRVLLVESAKRIRQWEQITQFVSSPLAVYELTPSGQKLLVTAAKSGRRVLSMIDEGLPVEEIVRRSFLGRFSVYKTISELVQTKAIAERSRDTLENLAADKMRTGSFKTARFIYKRLLELAQAPIEIQRAREQLAYLDQLERTESKVMAARAGERIDVTESHVVTRALPVMTTTRKTRVIRRLRIEVVALAAILLIALGTVVAIFSVPAVREALLDPGQAEIGALLASVDSAVSLGEYETAYRACQDFLIRHPGGKSREQIEAKLVEIKTKMDAAVKEGMALAMAMADEHNYQGALDRLDALLSDYPSNSYRVQIIMQQEATKRRRNEYVEKTTAEEAVSRLAEAKKMFTEGRLDDAVGILKDISSAPKVPDTVKSEGAMLLNEVRGLERALDELFASGLSKETAGDYEGALAAYKQVANRSPLSARALKARQHAEPIEENKSRLRSLLDRADKLVSEGKPREASDLLEQVARRSGYSEADVALSRLAPIKDKFERSKKVLAAYQEAVKKQDYVSAAQYARSLHEDYAGFVDMKAVLFPVTVHSVPSAAEVRVDGNPVGSTPCTVLVPSDRRTPVRFSAPGFIPADVVINDPAKGVYRVYLERRPERRISLAAPVVWMQTYDADRLIVALAGNAEDPHFRLGILTVSDGNLRECCSLGVSQIQAAASLRGWFYFAGDGKITAAFPPANSCAAITTSIPVDAVVKALYVEKAPMFANRVVASVILGDGRSLGFAAEDGAQVWNEKAIEQTLSVALGPETILLYDGLRILCADRVAAAKRWQSDCGPLWAGPVISPAGWFGFVDRRMMLVIGSLATGDLLSQAALGSIRSLAQPLHVVAAEDLIYLASQEFLYVLKPGKGVVSDAALDRKIIMPPVVSPKNLYLVGDGAMYRIPKDANRPDWRYETRGSLANIIVTRNGIALAENVDGRGTILLFDE